MEIPQGESSRLLPGSRPGSGVRIEALSGALPTGTDSIRVLPSRISPVSLRCHYFGIFDVSLREGASTDSHAILRGSLDQWIARFFEGGTPPTTSFEGSKVSLMASRNDVDFSALRVAAAHGEPALESFALEHLDQNVTGRRWRTEIVMTATPSGMRLHVGLYHGLRIDYVGSFPEEPSPSVPNFVRALLEDPKVECRANRLRIYSKPIYVNDDQSSGELLAKLISDPKRTQPVILINLPEGVGHGGFLINPLELARDCVGAATVIVPLTHLLKEGPVLRTLASKLTPRHIEGLRGGGLRVYLPHVDLSNPRDYLRHRYFYPTADTSQVKGLRDSLFRHVLSGAQGRGEVCSFAQSLVRCARADEDARWRLLAEEILAATQNVSSSDGSPAGVSSVVGSNRAPGPAEGAQVPPHQDVAHLQSLLSRIQPGVEALRVENAELRLQVRTLEERSGAASAAEELLYEVSERADDEARRRHEAERKAEALRQKLEAKEVGDGSKRKLRVPAELPKTPSEVVEHLREELKPRIVILEKATRSAKELPSSLTEETWRFLVALHQQLWPLHFGENTPGADAGLAEGRTQKIPAIFTEKTGIEYTVNESSMTQKDEKLMRARRAVVDGVEFEFAAHLKGGGHPHFLRIHLAIDEDKQRILVWHVGGHLDTAGTRRQ